MGLDELLRTLKKDERKQIDDIWQEAKNEADILRKQVQDEIDATTKKQADQLASSCRQSQRLILSEAALRNRTKKLLAYQALDRALRAAAARQLPLLREKGYDRVFAELVAELPQRQWEKIVVNPDDHELAAKFFAPDIIQTDPAVSGGLLATAGDDKIIVDNTFGKRLQRKWRQILPTIISRIEKQYEKPGAFEKT